MRTKLSKRHEKKSNFVEWLHETKRYFAVNGKVYQANFNDPITVREVEPVFEFGEWRANDWQNYSESATNSTHRLYTEGRRATCVSWIDANIRQRIAPEVVREIVDMLVERTATKPNKAIREVITATR